jgi:hypothetical protein
MTKAQLEKAGIYPDKWFKQTHYHPGLNISLTLTSKTTLAELIEMIFEAGEEIGKDRGKAIKAQEIRHALNIPEEDEY